MVRLVPFCNSLCACLCQPLRQLLICPKLLPYSNPGALRASRNTWCNLVWARSRKVPSNRMSKPQTFRFCGSGTQHGQPRQTARRLQLLLGRGRGLVRGRIGDFLLSTAFALQCLAHALALKCGGASEEKEEKPRSRVIPRS